MDQPHLFGNEDGRCAADAARLWLQLVEKESRCKALEYRLAAMESSRSWRVTAPLRSFVSRFRRAPAQSVAARPALEPGCAPGAAVAWQPVFHEAARGMGLADGFGGHQDSPRCLVDVTELALQDMGAGVQRVTRRWLSELLVSPPTGRRMEPVRLSSQGEYVLAREFLAGMLGLGSGDLGEDRPIEARPTDCFLGLDFCRDHADVLDTALAGLREQRVPITLLLPDMLPLQHPEWFPPGIGTSFVAWLEVCIRRADQVVCISNDSLQAFKEELEGRPGLQDLRTVVVPLGADLPWASSVPLPTRRPGSVRLLMVGTVEPRKRYPQALDAFEMLEGMGEAVDLVIVGRRGWESQGFFRRLARHPQAGRNLHWLEDADDATLAAAYLDSDLLVMASAGEGYGLPVIEAANAGCRLLLRDLPVFREVAGDVARYFSGEQGADLAHAIQDAIKHPAPPETLHSRPWPSWQHSAFILKNETIQG